MRPDTSTPRTGTGEGAGTSDPTPIRTERPRPGDRALFSGAVLSRAVRLLGSGPGRRELRKLVASRLYRPPVKTHFNEAVNPETGVIYVAVPKTGSSTIRDQVSPFPYLDERYLQPAAHLDIVQIRDGILFFAQYQALDSNVTFPHTVPSTADVAAAARAQFDAAFKFSTVRNPWARAVSLYSRKEGVQVAGQISFAEFIERHIHASDTCASSTLHHNQVDWLTDESGEIAVDHVFRIEDLEREAPVVAEKSGGRVQLLAGERLNVNTRSRAARYRDMYDDRLKALVAQRFEKDIDLFGYTF